MLAGQTRGSPQLDSFGPDMQLASRLRALGERRAVELYLTDCLRFWKLGRTELERWLAELKAGQTPELVSGNA